MKGIFALLVLFLVFFSFQEMAEGHPGRLDSNGGHNCSEKSKAKGLCTGYHYHKGGGESSSDGNSTPSSPSSSTTSTPSSSQQSSDKDCSDFSSYDAVVEYWNAKGYSKTNDPERLDGWGNSVDDGIPCEAPDGYDTSKINGSPEQIAQQNADRDKENGENAGYAAGKRDGYKQNEKNPVISKGSAAYKEGYETGYDKGYEEGSEKIGSEKDKAEKDGYALGRKQDKKEIPAKYKGNEPLESAFAAGFERAIKEKDEKKKDSLFALGYKAGQNDKTQVTDDLKGSYLEAYNKGFEKGQTELKKIYYDKGYNAAFKRLEYKKPNLPKDKYIKWYKEGFDSNTGVDKIGQPAYDMGASGETLHVPKKYIASKVIYKHYYKLGAKEYESEQQKENVQTSLGIVVVIASWLARRLYVARKMVS
ncbi:hypothetical protein EV207_1227 [Scopulibacillus darangshiensis]|uniref:YHYH domain-containing protein n=1 Tax=Scopulibacillus darangshiensis TaxID=442528 RepID=A0A4R2NTT4_9BACL|nr:YHYH domain-containing protein [Scopulibacillus darangshiensis]TCP24904.1 hypothetical protein EV207_1227 [Scopulibacillus darangshiensis]